MEIYKRAHAIYKLAICNFVTLYFVIGNLVILHTCKLVNLQTCICNLSNVNL